MNLELSMIPKSGVISTNFEEINGKTCRRNVYI